MRKIGTVLHLNQPLNTP